jgi:hypothetical protein
LFSLTDAELAQLIATAALLPVEKRAASVVQRVAAALAAGETCDRYIKDRTDDLFKLTERGVGSGDSSAV